MPKPKPNRAREQRITDEIVVDAYTSEERAMSWYYYLDGNLAFPFKAKCIAALAVSPVEKEEQVEALKMAPEDDYMKEMFVLVRFGGRTLGMPLSQLKPLNADAGTCEAVDNWHYWVQRGYTF